MANSTNTKAVSPKIATRPFILSLYGLNPKSTFNPPDTGSFSGTGGRNIPDPEDDDDFLGFLPFRSSAFFPVPLRYRSRTCERRFSKESCSGSGSDPVEVESVDGSGSDWGSVARLVKEREGFGA